MGNKLEELARRRETLILRSGGQRERLAESCDQLAKSLRWTRVVKGIIQKIGANPVTVVGATALLGGAQSKFRRVSNLVSFGWSLFRSIRARRARRRFRFFG